MMLMDPALLLGLSQKLWPLQIAKNGLIVDANMPSQIAASMFSY